MVDLDSDPTKLIEIVEVGKQLLITRGALTTFSIANDIAKYFAILPAIFATSYAAEQGGTGPLDALNVMDLGTPRSAIISAIVFNALDHPGARAAGAARRALPGDRRHPAPAAQPPDLRPRRRDRALHRHQADRPADPQPARGRDLGRAPEGLRRAWPPASARPTRCSRRGRTGAATGQDVVIGWLEPHGRAETAAMAEGLEAVPPLELDHRGVPLRDMDVAAVSRARRRSRWWTSWPTRTPRACRAPSGTRTSQELQLAGIDVISTVNVQHLESLNDRILRAHRRPRARDDPRPGAPRRGRGRARRPDPRGAAGAAAGREGVPRGARRGGAAELLHDGQPRHPSRGRPAGGRRLGGRARAARHAGPGVVRRRVPAASPSGSWSIARPRARRPAAGARTPGGPPGGSAPSWTSSARGAPGRGGGAAARPRAEPRRDARARTSSRCPRRTWRTPS